MLNNIKSTRTILTPAEAADFLGVSPGFLSRDRWEADKRETSPKVPFVRLGHRTVRYHLNDLQKFLSANRVQ